MHGIFTGMNDSFLCSEQGFCSLFTHDLLTPWWAIHRYKARGKVGAIFSLYDSSLGSFALWLESRIEVQYREFYFRQSLLDVEHHHFDICIGVKFFGVGFVATEIKVKHPTDFR